MTELRDHHIPPLPPGLRALREDAGLTQKELAEACGVSQVAISWWEQGMKSPDYDRLPALAAVFGVDYNALVPSIIQTRRKAGI